MKIYNQKVYCITVAFINNSFCVYVLDTETDERILLDSFKKIREFFLTNRDCIMCGYNNIHYDNPLINLVIMNTDNGLLNLINQYDNIIRTGDPKEWKFLKYKDFFNTLDLKQLIETTDNTILTDIKVAIGFNDITQYTNNAVNYYNNLMFYKELLYSCKDKIKCRLYIENKYGVNIMNKDVGGIGLELLASKYNAINNVNITKFKPLANYKSFNIYDLILTNHEYRDEQIQRIYNKLRAEQINLDKKNKTLKFFLHGLDLSITPGSIHSINSPECFEPSNDETILEIDIASAFPTALKKYKIKPEQLNTSFNDIFNKLLIDRLKVKQKKCTILDELLKKSLNSIIGHMSQSGSWLYDPKAYWTIKINSQLLLLDILDNIIKFGCKFIQINTDGCIVIVNKNSIEKIKEYQFRMHEEEGVYINIDELDSIYQLNVSDYIAKTKDGKIIKKGIFSYSTKRDTPKVVIDAVIENIYNKKDVYKHIMTAPLKDFILYSKADKQYNVFYGENIIGNYNRYIYTTDGCQLYKINNKGVSQLISKDKITLMNNLSSYINEKKINYNKYVMMAKDLLRPLKTKQLKLF